LQCRREAALPLARATARLVAAGFAAEASRADSIFACSAGPATAVALVAFPKAARARVRARSTAAG